MKYIENKSSDPEPTAQTAKQCEQLQTRPRLKSSSGAHTAVPATKESEAEKNCLSSALQSQPGQQSNTVSKIKIKVSLFTKQL